MKRRNAEEVGSVAHQWLRANGLEGPLNEYRLKAAWPAVAGEIVAQATRRLEIRNQTLVVSLSSSVLRGELSMRRAELIARLNKVVGVDLIYNIVFQ